MPVLTRLKAIQHLGWIRTKERQGGSVLPIHPPTTKLFPLHVMKLADSYIDAQEGALLAQDAIAEWLDRYRLELDSQTEQVIYEGILDSLKRADLIEVK